MKKKSRKTTTKPWALGTVGLLALGFCAGASPQGALQGAECCPKGNAKAARNVQHELVPHIVLPETIQYDKTAKSHRAHPGLDSAGDYGMVSPYVATYVPFPSYQLPMSAQLRPVNQSVYPAVPPAPKALPLPKASQKEAEPVDSEIVWEKKDSSDGDTDVAPILLASGREDVVHATPLSELDNEVTQTGIFCQKPAKPPAAWSFTSPIFKAASVPMGWGAAGHNGMISQYGPRGCMTQVGFTPMGGDGMQPGMMQGMQPPMRTIQGGPGVGNGPQIQQLPNGMLMVTMPPDHARCGLLRCRCGNQPRTMFLPAAPGGMPGGMPGMMPQTPPAVDPQSMMPMMMNGGMAGMNPMGGMGMGMMNVGYGQQSMGMNPMMMQQPQMEPVTTMTPYGPMVVGYRPAMNPMMGMGMMQAAYAQQMQQQQMQMLQQQWAQYEAMMRQATEAGAADSKDDASGEPKAPRPIDSPMLGGMMPGMMANPFGMYAQQAGADGQAKAQPNAQDADAAEGMCPMTGGMTMSPMMFFSNPMMMPQMPQMQQMMPQGQMGGMYMTPYGMMAMNPMMGGMGYGMMNPMMMPGMMNVGYGQQPMMNQGGMNMSDVIQLVMLLNNNKQERRRGLFARIAERREARRERRHGGMDDPLAQLMQAWSTPYSPADSVMRMPSRNAYPYGFFGAQPGPQDTANYGGFYNLYMGNTSYPGMY